MAAYYNEIDAFAAQWLRNLIAAGHIAPGEVDERSITDVQPDDLRGFDQCHFFAGIGGWSYALRLAGWPDDRPVWTGSCPCQPFSTAGKQRGGEDERHLWPAWRNIIAKQPPPIIFGEQVAGSGGLAWFDRVAMDLENIEYAVASAVMPACGFGAPHKRERLWFVANAIRDEQSRQESCRGKDRRVGGGIKSIPWNEPWQDALARLRVLDYGLPRCVVATDAARNAIVPQVAAEFIAAYMECRP